MITALMTVLMLTVRPIQPDRVVATVSAVGDKVVAVEVVENDNIEIYEFYGTDFHIGDDVTLLMVGDAIVGVAER